MKALWAHHHWTFNNKSHDKRNAFISLYYFGASNVQYNGIDLFMKQSGFISSVGHRAHAIYAMHLRWHFFSYNDEIRNKIGWFYGYFMRLCTILILKCIGRYLTGGDFKCSSDAVKWIKLFELETLSFYNRFLLLFYYNWHTRLNMSRGSSSLSFNNKRACASIKHRTAVILFESMKTKNGHPILMLMKFLMAKNCTDCMDQRGRNTLNMHIYFIIRKFVIYFFFSILVSIIHTATTSHAPSTKLKPNSFLWISIKFKMHAAVLVTVVYWNAIKAMKHFLHESTQSVARSSNLLTNKIQMTWEVRWTNMER